MTNYRGSIRKTLVLSIWFTLLAALQLALNIRDDRIVFVILYSVMLVVFAVLLILTALDLILKDTTTMQVQVIQTRRDIIKVLKPNGRKRRIRVVSDEAGQYREGQQLELTLTRRIRQVLEVKQLAEGEK
ncbi:hypothetical protein COLU111180_16375 [Cohnella lubricantis]|uniref:Uncharacterized protein n=1 Tax=Cohnella lubricantis TaxID=2163172 RepID=A0A841TAI9_9BACL|nr:hypothetical protein [Cohnella lubricantis]MBB6677049.1 hypothetical protein [Cohnella lubricantis]MBP2119281.1 hypothetical protein [Cohnella lubricantis]